MKWIKARKHYRGFDPEEKQEFFLPEGAVREVSDEKAEQLQTDFPDDFEFSDTELEGDVEVPGNPPPPGDPAGEPDEDPDPEPTLEEREGELLQLKRDELDEMAAGLGVEDPEGLDNKPAVVAAILEAEASGEPDEE